MASDLSTSDRVWPKSGLWGASFRVMFPLAAIWAVICVALWQWGALEWPNLDLTLGWHIHEMTFGFGGAAVAGYLLTACSSWTGRAPISGGPLMALAALWCLSRLGMFWHGILPIWSVAAVSFAYFWWIAILLGYEAAKAGKGWRPLFIAFCLLAGLGSALWIIQMNIPQTLPIFIPAMGFALLVSIVSLRMVPAFLQNAAVHMGRSFKSIPNWEYSAQITALLIAAMAQFVGYPIVAGVFYFAAGFGVLIQLCRWPLRPALNDCLLAMLVLGVLWLPIGMLMLGRNLMADLFTTPAATHALMMGAMGGLVMAISARAFARRTDQGLRARRGTFVAFLLVMAATVARLAQELDLAAALWCAGWALYLVLILPHRHGPVPRPVFSGARKP